MELTIKAATEIDRKPPLGIFILFGGRISQAIVLGVLQ